MSRAIMVNCVDFQICPGLSMSRSYVRTISSSITASLAASVPRFAQSIFGAIEMAAARAQGRGSGSASIRDEVRAILPLLPLHGGVVFDVGANSGRWARLLLASAAPRVARLIAVEPSLTHRHVLERLLPFPHEHLAVALGANVRQQLLFSDSLGSALASLYRRDLSHVGLTYDESELVQTTTLDDVIREKGVGIIDLLKMDAEGAELDILRGAAGALRARRVRALTFEFGGCNVDSRTYFRDFWSLLCPLGYSIFRIVPGGRLVPIRKYSERHEFFLTTNYVAVLNGA
jgi:FkbM family methyltransferase